MKKTVKYTHSEYVGSRSSAIDEVIYDEGFKELYVVFRNSGRIAGYRGVEYGTYLDFINSDSVGKFYNSNIVGLYKGTSGDVQFVKKQVPVNHGAYAPVAVPAPAAPTAPTAEYRITFEVSGTLTITGLAESMDDAVSKANQLLSEQMVGNFKVKEVTRKFD